MTIHQRHLGFRPSTLDWEARTVDAIATTFADVPRPGFVERLDPKGMNLDRLIGGPVLDGHRNQVTGDILGVIEAARVTPEGLLVTLRIRQGETGDTVLRDIEDGVLRGVSVGYTVENWRASTEGKTTVRTATAWTPRELSLVPLPADPGAHFRAGDHEMTTTADPVEVQNRTATRTEIRSIARLAGLSAEWADAQIDADATPDEARAAAFAAMQAAPRARSTGAQITLDHTDPAVIATRAGEAIYARIHPDHGLSPEARQYAGMSLPMQARASLQRAGLSVMALSDNEVVTRALHSTGDFPLILGDFVGRELRRAYAAPASGVRPLARQATRRDFRAGRAIMMGAAPGLEKVLEGAEYSYGTIAESGEAYTLTTWGKIFSVSRQAIINDDLGAFAQIPARMGAAAAATEAAQLAAMITSNPVMSDGQPVFHASHGNLGAAAVISLTSLSAARLAIRRQTGLSADLLGLQPRYLLVPPELETLAEQVLAAVTATKTADANPFSNLSLAVEPRLTSATQWYLVADPAQIDGLEFAYLEGAPGPQIDTNAGFQVDGLQMKVRLDFGCGWIDHRGWYRNG